MPDDRTGAHTGYYSGSYYGGGSQGEEHRFMKVFAMNDFDWWAAETLEEAKLGYLKERGMEEADGPFDDPHELDEEAMNHFQFNEDDGKRSFREQLERMVSSGQKFPAFFASTEY
jgi:hypothetical protein